MFFEDEKMSDSICEINLSYYKKGIDFSEQRENAETDVEALENQAAMLERDAKALRAIAELIKGQDVEIVGDTHHLEIFAESELIEELEKRGLITVEVLDNAE